MLKFNIPPYVPPQDIQRFACELAMADGLDPYAYVSVPVAVPFSFGQPQGTQMWQTYLPKVMEFLQTKVIYDRLFTAQILPMTSPAFPTIMTAALPNMTDQEIETYRERALVTAADASKKIDSITIRQLAKNHKIKRYKLRECGLCGTPLFYNIDSEGNRVSYSSNCDCSRDYSPPEQRCFNDLADCFNIQSKPETRQRMLCEFIESGEKQTEA